MNLAASLLLEGNTSISKISELCGYSSPSYFTKVFRRNFNQSPRNFMTHGTPPAKAE
ncbi:MAG: helix-turn-helix transcriptional regulator [Firmicutes bacterium]|nr:helix-turn-helix transcriptional regulator [Bacillota bacterium]